MKLAFPSPEFDEAVAAVSHGVATEVQAVALHEILRISPAARDEYLFRVELHSRLASDPDLFAAEPADDREEAAFTHAPIPFPPGARRNRRRAAQMLAVAAGLIVLAALTWTFGAKLRAARTSASSAAVAMLSRVVDARWTMLPNTLRVGSALEPGRFRLEAGLAEIVFYSGARVVIEGPAELDLISSSEARCFSGRFLAEIPSAARGFRLRADEWEVVDFGSRFGLEAISGKNALHVFGGKMLLQSPAGETWSLTEGQAVELQEKVPQFITATAELFAAMFDFEKRSQLSEAVRYDQWRLAAAQLKHDPALVVRFDFEDLSDASWALVNTASQANGGEEAVIVGCQRAEGRWREKQAIEFQSVNDRVRLSVPGEFQALTISAWVSVKGLDRQFNSLFMSDGFDLGTVHWLIRNDGVLGLTVFGLRPGEFQIMASPPVITLESFGLWLHLAVVVDGRSGRVIQYVNGAPVSRHVLKMVPPFRVGAAELGNWNPPNEPNPSPALIRNLSGSMDEFELFNRALSESEIGALYAQGKPER